MFIFLTHWLLLLLTAIIDNSLQMTSYMSKILVTADEENTTDTIIFSLRTSFSIVLWQLNRESRFYYASINETNTRFEFSDDRTTSPSH